MNLREYIEKIRELGELREIKGVDWNLEIGAITLYLAKHQKLSTLLFDKIKDYQPGYRILASPCSSEKSINLLLGLPLELRGLEIVKKLRNKLSEPLKLIPPVEVKDGPDTGECPSRR